MPGLLLLAALALHAAEPVTLASLLAEVTDRGAVARWPQPAWRSLQASSYNRASVHRDRPGWFADSDGTGFIRTEQHDGRTEWVLLEHDGPGCLTKFWTPFFYYGLADHTGPNVRVYLDGAATPVLDESLIKLVRGEGSVPPPWGAPTARAGNLYLPLPFGRGCKVTLTAKPFYFIINYRAYPPGTSVETFRPEQLRTQAELLTAAGARLLAAAPAPEQRTVKAELTLAPGQTQRVELPPGPAAVARLVVQRGTAGLRSTVLSAEFDGEPTVWAPLGDFFGSPDALHPFGSWERTVADDGTLTCRWLMPYRERGALALTNLGATPVTLTVDAGLAAWTWDERSLHFHASWRPDELLPGTPIVDWNFVDITGQGLYVGDTYTVLNPTQGWWGEGDEKIYVDDAWDAGFPTHFGTGTEDYYGWAGGLVPTRADEFSRPFVANVRVGGVEGQRTRGYNVLTRTRSLDAIPFERRLRFDMEASPGTDQRRRTDFLGYSVVTCWYARPGATCNRGAQPLAAGKPLMSLADLAQAAGRTPVAQAPAGTIECEDLKPTATSPGLGLHNQRPAESMRPEQWSGERHLFIASRRPGEFVELTLTEQFAPAALELGLTTSYDFGVVRLSVNGRVVADRVDLFSERPGVRVVPLGRCEPVDNRFVLRCELVEPSAQARGARTFMGLDYVRIK